MTWANTAHITMNTFTGTPINNPVQVGEPLCIFFSHSRRGEGFRVDDKRTLTPEELRRHRILPMMEILKTQSFSDVRSSNFVKSEEWVFLDPTCRRMAWGMAHQYRGESTYLYHRRRYTYGTNTHRVLLYRAGEAAPARAILQWVK